MKTFTKSLLTVTAALTAVIAVQMLLTRAFSFHTGELFSKTALTALYFFFLFRCFRTRRQRAD